MKEEGLKLVLIPSIRSKSQNLACASRRQAYNYVLIPSIRSKSQNEYLDKTVLPIVVGLNPFYQV